MLDKGGLRFRAAVFQSVRRFFARQGFIEVDTPIRLPHALPEAAIDLMRSESWYLQPSPELSMKRLLAHCSTSMFQLCHCFRSGERGRYHLEEFTMLEWYRIDSDYTILMDDCQNLLRCIVGEQGEELSRRGTGDETHIGTVSLTSSWERLSVRQAFGSWSPQSVEAALSAGRFEEMMVDYIEPQLGRHTPCFLYDYPAACGSLARLKEGEPDSAERFELYIDGVELANGFSELTDPEQQRARFLVEQEQLKERGIEPPPIPEQFLDALNGLDNVAGIALGFDRLLQLLLAAQRIDDVVSVPPGDWQRGLANETG